MTSSLAPQVEDSQELLNLMVSDMANAPEHFRPTNYWKVYEERFLPELRTLGLRDYRRRHGSVLASFGATDLKPSMASINLNNSKLFNNRISRQIPGWHRFVHKLNAFLNRPGYQPLQCDLYDCTLGDLQFSAYQLTRLYGQKVGAKPLENLECSLAGNPEDFFEVEGRTYTWRGLYYYLRYAYCQQFVNFDKLKVIAELGSGSGKQVEVVRKLYPEISFLLFDIPPQLYVCEQYLKRVFPNAVRSYEFTRNNGFRWEDSPGSITIMGAWQFPMLQEIQLDLFWNAVSFQEMEPEVVGNYLSYIDRGNATSVYLQQMMEGKGLAARRGLPGVLRKTTLADYERGLSNFEMVDLSQCLRPLGTLAEHQDSFWRRKSSTSVEQGKRAL